MSFTAATRRQSERGCTVFVKLWQFDPDGRTHVRVDMNKTGAVADATRPGVAVAPLFKDDREEVRLETWSPGASGTFKAEGGAELLVLDSTTEESDALRKHSRVRVPWGAQSPSQGGAETASGALTSAGAPRDAPGRSETRRREHDYSVGVPRLAAPVTREAAASPRPKRARLWVPPLRRGLAGFCLMGGSRIDVCPYDLT